MAELIYTDTSFSCKQFADSVCMFGVFDGLHLGHRYLFEQTKKAAHDLHVPCGALTFSIDPDELFKKDTLMKLATNEERIAALCALPLDYVAVIPFDRTAASVSAEDFLNAAFGTFTPLQVHVGSGFRYGSRAQGTVESLEAWGKAHGMTVQCHTLFQHDGVPVSSTRIRKLLQEGNTAAAQALLGESL